MMEGWQSRFVCLVVSAIVATHSVATVESRFLTGAKHGDTALQNIRSRALPAVSKDEGLAEMEKQEGGSRKVYTAKRLLEEKAEGKGRSKPSVGEGSSTKVKKDGEKSTQTKDNAGSNAEGEVSKDEGAQEEAAEAEPVGEAVTDLLLWYLSPYLLPRPQQDVSPPRRVLPPLAHDAVATPLVAPDFHNFSTLPSYPSFVVAPTLPEPPRSPQYTPTPAKEETEDSSTQKFGIREAKGGRSTPQSFPAFPLTVWLKLIANALSDEVYQTQIHRQTSSPAQSNDSFAREAVEDEAKSGADRVEVESTVDNTAARPADPDVKQQFNEKPLKAPLLLNPLPGFKMNKSMRPYVTTPIPLSPFYTFDKPRHFFPPSFLSPVQELSEPEESETPVETTLPADEPTAESVESVNQQAEAPELRGIEDDGVTTSGPLDRADR